MKAQVLYCHRPSPCTTPHPGLSGGKCFVWALGSLNKKDNHTGQWGSGRTGPRKPALKNAELFKKNFAVVIRTEIFFLNSPDVSWFKLPTACEQMASCHLSAFCSFIILVGQFKILLISISVEMFTLLLHIMEYIEPLNSYQDFAAALFRAILIAPKRIIQTGKHGCVNFLHFIKRVCLNSSVLLKCGLNTFYTYLRTGTR